MPLPEVVTVPHWKGPDPTKLCEAIGSYEAEAFAGSTVMRLTGKFVHAPVQLIVAPVSVYWTSRQEVLVEHEFTELVQDVLPALVQ